MLVFIATASLAALLNLAAAAPRDAVADGTFTTEGTTGTWSAWSSCGTTAPPAPALVDRPLRDDPYAARLGAFSGNEIAGDMGICQQVRVPAAGRVMLDFWARSGSTEADATHAYQEVGFFDGTTAMDRGAPMQMLVHGMPDASSFRHYTFDVTPLAGQLLYLYFGVHGDGNPNAHTWFEFDHVSLVVDVPATRSV